MLPSSSGLVVGVMASSSPGRQPAGAACRAILVAPALRAPAARVQASLGAPATSSRPAPITQRPTSRATTSMPPPLKDRSRAPVSTSLWVTAAEAGFMIRRPFTTTLPLDARRRSARGSNISWPPGMTATPATFASTSRKIGRVTTAVSPGPGTPRDQERLSLQRLQPSGTLVGWAAVVELAATAGRATVVVVAAPSATEASSQGSPNQRTPPATAAAPRAPAPIRTSRRVSRGWRCSRGSRLSPSAMLDLQRRVHVDRADPHHRPRGGVQVGPGHVEVGGRVPGQHVPSGHVEDTDPDVETAPRQRQAGDLQARLGLPRGQLQLPPDQEERGRRAVADAHADAGRAGGVALQHQVDVEGPLSPGHGAVLARGHRLEDPDRPVGGGAALGALLDRLPVPAEDLAHRAVGGDHAVVQPEPALHGRLHRG